jgi:hypothetical protein
MSKFLIIEIINQLGELWRIGRKQLSSKLELLYPNMTTSLGILESSLIFAYLLSFTTILTRLRTPINYF